MGGACEAAQRGNKQSALEQTRGAQKDLENAAEHLKKQLEQLEQEACRRWPVIECVLVHRLGRVELGQASVLVAVSTPHRRDAFDAAQWLMDRIKEVVPIWKQEHWVDGSTDWVHPGLPPSSK